MMVLCGSCIAFMEEDVLGSKSPLFGRRTFQMELDGLSIYEAREMFPKYSIEELILLYSTSGGTPQYLVQFDSNTSLRDNIINNVLTPGSYLFTEPVDLLRQELRDITIYNTILTVIAGGASRFNEIVTASHEKNDKIANYLKTLQRLRLVKKMHPVTEKPNSKKSIYRITDNMFRFHYKYVLPMKEQLEEGNASIVYSVIMNDIPQYIGYIFEDICLQFISKLNQAQKLPIFYEKIGKWWGTDNRKKTQSEIDIMAVSRDGAIFGECKYQNEKTGQRVLDGLMDKAAQFPHKDKHYFLFSKSGFCPALPDNAKMQSNIQLYSLDNIFFRS